MPVKDITNKISSSIISYKKLKKVARKVETALKHSDGKDTTNEYSKLYNSDGVLEICKRRFEAVDKRTYNLWKENNFEKNYLIKFIDLNGDISSFTLLQMFSHFKCVEAVKELLREGVNVNKTNESGRVALHEAVIIKTDKKKAEKEIRSSIEITELLLEKNANVEIRDKSEKNALKYSIKCNNSQVTKLLTVKYITMNTMRNTDIIKNKEEYNSLLDNSKHQEFEQSFDSNHFDDVPLCDESENSTEKNYLQKDINNSKNRQFNISAAIMTGIAIPLVLAYTSWLPVLAVVIVAVTTSLIVGKLFSPSSVLDEVIYNKLNENLLSR